MRIAALIIGLLVGLLLFVQSWTIGIFSETTVVDDVTASAGGAGLIMALAWLLASALVIPFPLVSTIIYGLTVPIGLFTPTGDFGDLRFHGFVAIVLTLMALFGWRGKKMDAREKLAERQRQQERDARLESLLSQQSTTTGTRIACPSCGQANSGTSRFCASCGAALNAGPA